MLAGLHGLDHAVFLVRNLDAAALAWRALGFTLSPRGTHAAQWGTANHTLMLGADYLELLGVLQDTPLNRPMRDCLQRRGDCLERMALLSHDAAATAQALRDRGIDAHGPLACGLRVRYSA